MIAAPALAPVTTPVADPTVAIVVLPLTQCPPVVASDRVVVVPTQTVASGVVIGTGGVYKNNSNPGEVLEIPEFVHNIIHR